jgi:hypothetical protein
MEREERLKSLRKKDQAVKLERVSSLHLELNHGSPYGQKKEETKIAQERKEKKWQKEHAYDELFTGEDPEEANNQYEDGNDSDDFM